MNAFSGFGVRKSDVDSGVSLAADDDFMSSFLSIEGTALQYGFLPLEFSRHSCVASAEAALRILGRQESSSAPWLPISTLGPLLVFAHHKPRCKDTWGVPDFLCVKVVISEDCYTRLWENFSNRIQNRPLPEESPWETMNRPLLDEDDLRGAFEWLVENYPFGAETAAVLTGSYNDLVAKGEELSIAAFNGLQQHLGVALQVICKPGILALNPEDAPKQQKFPAVLLDKHSVYPAYVGTTKVYLLTDGGDTYAFEDEWLSSGNDPIEVIPVLADESAIKKVVNRAAGGGSDQVGLEVNTSEFVVSDDASLVEIIPEDVLQINPQNVNHSPEELLKWCLYRAIQNGASDLHLEKYYNTLRFRARIDGHLKVIFSASEELLQRYIAIIKNYSNLGQSRQEAQDGRFAMAIGSRRIDVRVAAVPCRKEFQKVIMRFLDKDGGMKSMGDLNLSERQSGLLDQAMARDQGLILITGPTGSGKTTTLYALLNSVNDDCRNIHTIEDPIEYRIEGINQTQTDPVHGINFASGIRALLRSDPDVILIGECRDEETAMAAVTAAMTGHLVLTTLHANDSMRAISRLLSMGVPNYLLADSLVLSQAQRLVRKLCPYCKRPVELTDQLIEHLQGYGVSDISANATVFEKVGCEECGDSGYAGRIALMEIAEITPEMKDMISDGVPLSEVRGAAISNGLKILYQEGLAQVLAGRTSLAEIKGLAYAKALTKISVSETRF